MKRYLLMTALLVTVSMTSLLSLSVLAAESPAASTLQAIQLNQATAEELQALPGVGPALSERIVLYRTEHGPFKNVDQLTEVKGVGQNKLAKFREQLTVD